MDVLRLEDALRIAKNVKEFVDFIEAGTPLIKSNGIGCVKILKDEFPDKKIVADMKTMDTGYLEVEMAARAGADIVSILGVAPNETITAAISAANDYGIEIMVDMIGVRDLEERLKVINELRPEYILLHTGIDQQKHSIDLTDKFRKVHNLIKSKKAIAGGLTPEKIKMLKGLQIDVVIVGSYITKASDPAKAALEVKKVIQWLTQ